MHHTLYSIQCILMTEIVELRLHLVDCHDLEHLSAVTDSSSAQNRDITVIKFIVP